MSEKVEKAMKYLANTDEPHALAKALVKAMDYKIKTVRALAFLQASGTVAEREAQSSASKEYCDFVERYQNAVADYELMENKRTTAQLEIDIWRSLEASRRKL